MPLSVVLSNTAGIPIYEQIKRQIKEAILTDRVAVDERLPSIRVLARDLRVSVITTTRAYSDLTAEGFVANVPGKGSSCLVTRGSSMSRCCARSRGISAAPSSARTSPDSPPRSSTPCSIPLSPPRRTSESH